MVRMILLSVVLFCVSIGLRATTDFFAQMDFKLRAKAEQVRIATEDAERLDESSQAWSEVIDILDKLPKNEQNGQLVAKLTRVHRLHEKEAEVVMGRTNVSEAFAFETMTTAIGAMHRGGLCLILVLWLIWIFESPNYPLFFRRRLEEFLDRTAARMLDLNYSRMPVAERGQVVNVLGVLRWHAEQILVLLSVLTKFEAGDGALIRLIKSVFERCLSLFRWGAVPAVAPSGLDYHLIVESKVAERLGEWHQLQQTAEAAQASVSRREEQIDTRTADLARREELLDRNVNMLVQLEASLVGPVAHMPDAPNPVDVPKIAADAVCVLN